MNKQRIRSAIRPLNLSNQVLCIHSSLSSFGFVQGGAAAVVDAFLEEGCTLLVPSFTYEYAHPAPEHVRYEHNAYQPCTEAPENTPVFDPAADAISCSMGAIPREIVRRPQRVRGMHPINSFTAIGPHARTLVATQTPLNVYGPLEQAAELDAKVILMGVGLSSMTAIHLAEQQAGRNLFRRWHLNADGSIGENCVGSCSEGFESLAPQLLPFEEKTRVGASLWRIYPLRQTLQMASKAIQANPEITRCEDPGCQRCQAMMLGGPVIKSQRPRAVCISR